MYKCCGCSGAGLGHPGRAAGVQRAAGRAARAAAARARAGRQPVRAHARGPARRQLRGRYAPLLNPPRSAPATRSESRPPGPRATPADSTTHGIQGPPKLLRLCFDKLRLLMFQVRSYFVSC